MRPSRQSRERLGRVAEALTAWRLAAAGYRTVARRAKTPFGEIDLVVLKGDVAAIVEVKARRDFESGVAAVTPRQRRRLQQAAEWLAAQRPSLAKRRLRFDIVVVRLWRLPRHLPDAWRP